jgi:hypothetical protein
MVESEHLSRFRRNSTQSCGASTPRASASAACDQLRRTRLKPRDILAALKTLLDEETPQATSPDAE